MRFEKRASVDWTVGKLLNIILALVVLALVVYGISTQSLNPLIDNISGKFDEVKILFNLKDDVASGDCHEERVSISSEGREFLKAIGMDGRDVILNVCKNRICNISGAGVTPYRVNGEKFEKWEGEKWQEYNSVFIGSVVSAQSNWEMYNAGVDVLSEVKDLYDKGFSQQFVLYGDGAGMTDEIYAVWQNGEWRVTEGGKISSAENWVRDGNNWVLKDWWGKIIKEVKNHYDGTDDDKAIDAFTNVAWKSVDIDDNVYWKETIPIISDRKYISSPDHGELIRPVAGSGWSFKADDAIDVERLKSLFKEKKKGYLEEAKLSVEELSDVIDTNEVKIDDKTFEVGIEEGGNFPIVSFSSGDEKFGLRHSAYAKINSNLLKGIKLRYFPVVLVKWAGSEWKEIGNEEYYRLFEKDFEEVKRATLISQFLKSRCK